MVDAAAARAAKKELNRIERQLAKLTEAEAKLHDQLAVSASDYARLAELDAELRKLADERGELESRLVRRGRTGRVTQPPRPARPRPAPPVPRHPSRATRPAPPRPARPGPPVPARAFEGITGSCD